MSMIRKQIFITEELDRRLIATARRQRKPAAQVVRDALAEALPRDGGTASEALLRLARLGKELDIRLPADASARHDDYLYGNDK